MNWPIDHALQAGSPAEIVARALRTDRRVLLFGQAGVGKSTLARALAAALYDAGRRCCCLAADPGSPRFGLPGAVCLASWEGHDWRLLGYEAVCTLDAGRFRLPLSAAVRRLAARAPEGTLLIDGPGVVRGVAGAELLEALTEAGNVDLVLALQRAGGRVPLSSELRALRAEVVPVTAAAQAARPAKRRRARERTALWDAYLQSAERITVDLARLKLLGTPPPVDVTNSWAGRQIALLAAGRVLVMGEALALQANRLQIRAPSWQGQADALLVRDALRTGEGHLNTARPFASSTLAYLPPPDVMPHQDAADSGGPRPVVRTGVVDAVLLNGVCGDPLLHLRLRHQKRSLLFDLGMPGRLSARIAHQVSDVFISHAHIDHIGGFLWLLRSRIGETTPCRLYGPPGLADNIEGMIRGIHWDRVGERGPRFEVAELKGDRLIRFQLQAGHADRLRLADQPAAGGVLLNESGFKVRAVTLDHGTPVLAFAFEPSMQISVRKDRLQAKGWAPGAWLGALKDRLLQGDRAALVELPDGTRAEAGRLGEELTLIKAGRKLVYATDLADTADNRQRLVQLAWGGHTLLCEAAFSEADAEQARRTGHLTTRACGEIANAADVGQLIPFHFSRRYTGNVAALYAEIGAVCTRLATPHLRKSLRQ
jgi:ribonuclease BN (tRNA processing enzyme)